MVALSPQAVVRQVGRALAPLADKERAAQMRAYLRGQFDFLGITAPARRQAIKALGLPSMGAKDALRAAQLLWEKKPREHRYTAIDILDRNARSLGARHLPRIKRLLQRESWWETVDGLAGVIGRVVRQEKDRGSQEVMDRWLRDDDFWVRRVAMIHQLGWRAETDARRLFAYAETLAAEKEFFVRKAIGWALRDFARTDPGAVRRFLREKGERFSGLTVREAAKHLG